MESWVKDFLEGTSESPVTPVQDVRKESRRRSLRIIKRQSIDTFYEPIVENPGEQFEDDLKRKRCKLSENDYGHVFVEVDISDLNSHRRRRSVANSVKKRRSQIFISADEQEKENQCEQNSVLNTFDQVDELQSEFEAYVSTSEKPQNTKPRTSSKAKRRRSGYHRRRSRILKLGVELNSPETVNDPYNQNDDQDDKKSPLKHRTLFDSPLDTNPQISVTETSGEANTGYPFVSESVNHLDFNFTERNPFRGFTGLVFSELPSESPETCRSTTPDSLIPRMQSYLCPEGTTKKGNCLDMSNESSDLDDMLSPERQVWIDAADHDHYFNNIGSANCPSPEAENVTTPIDTEQLGFGAHQAEACDLSVPLEEGSDWVTPVVGKPLTEPCTPEVNLVSPADITGSGFESCVSSDTPDLHSPLTPEISPTCEKVKGTNMSSPFSLVERETFETPSVCTYRNVTPEYTAMAAAHTSPENDFLMEVETPSTSKIHVTSPSDQVPSPGVRSCCEMDPNVSKPLEPVTGCSSGIAHSPTDSVPASAYSMAFVAPVVSKTIASPTTSVDSPVDSVSSRAYVIESPIDPSMETSSWQMEDTLLPTSVPTLESEIDSKPRKTRRGRKRKTAINDVEGEETNAQDTDVYGPSRRSTRVRRKSVELFHSQQLQLQAQETNSPSDGGGDVNLPSTSAETGPKKRKRKTEKKENIEDIYLNKHYKQPTEKLWETIYEDTDRQKGLSQRRLRRSITFDMYTVPPAKIKRRAQKASKLGFGPSTRRKRAIPQHQFELKLMALQEELGDIESP